MNDVLVFLKKKFDRQSKILFKNTSWIVGSNFLKAGLSFVRSIIVARGLGIHFYGTYVLITTFVTAAQDFFNLNVGAAFIKFGAEFKTENRTDKVVALIKGCVLVTLITAVLSIITISILVTVAYDYFVSTPGMEKYIILYAIADIVTFFDPVGRSILRLYYKFKVNSIVQTLTALLEVIVIAIVIFLFPNELKPFFIAYVSVKILNSIINNSVGFYELRHEFIPFINTKMSLLKDRWKEIASFVTGNSLTKTLQTVIVQGDILLLGTMTGTGQVAYYNVGKRLANLLMVITDPFTQGIYPQLSRLLADKKYAEIKIMLKKLTTTILYPLIILVPFVFFMRNPLIQLIYGKEYLPASDPFIISIVGTAIASIFFWNQSFMQSAGLIRFRFFVYLSAIIGGGATAYLLIPDFGASGLAVGVVLTKIILNVAFTTAAYHNLKQTN